MEDWEVEKVVAEKDAATNDATDARKTLVLVLLILAASMVSNAITMVRCFHEGLRACVRRRRDVLRWQRCAGVVG